MLNDWLVYIEIVSLILRNTVPFPVLDGNGIKFFKIKSKILQTVPVNKKNSLNFYEVC